MGKYGSDLICKGGFQPSLFHFSPNCSKVANVTIYAMLYMYICFTLVLVSVMSYCVVCLYSRPFYCLLYDCSNHRKRLEVAINGNYYTMHS